MTEAPTVREIMKAWLEEHEGYDGLCESDAHCYCMDDEWGLIACGGDWESGLCRPGHKTILSDGTWRMVPGKREADDGTLDVV